MGKVCTFTTKKNGYFITYSNSIWNYITSNFITQYKKSNNRNSNTSSNTHNPEDEQIYKEEIAEASPKEIEVKSIQKPMVKTTTTKIKMKIKAKERDGIVKAKVSITHNMLTMLINNIL